MNNKHISKREISLAIAALITMPLLLLVLSVFATIYLVIPYWYAEHPQEGFLYPIGATAVFLYMLLAFSNDGYEALKIFYHFQENPKKKRSVLAPVIHMLFSYLYSIYFFAVDYDFISHLWPETFSVNKVSLSVVDSLYFSVATATTIGYGDIAPKMMSAKIIVMVQAILSLGYVIFLFSQCSTHIREGALAAKQENEKKNN